MARWPGDSPADSPATLAEPWTLPDDLTASGVRLLERNDRAVFELQRTAALRALTRRRTALERRADAIRGDLARLDHVGELQKIGQLLLAQGGRIPRGAKEAELDDWETGGKLHVTLDPARPAKAQAEGFFARARRLQRGETVMRQRLDDTTRAFDRIENLHAEVTEALDTRALETALANVRAAGISVETDVTAASGKSSQRGSRLPFHRYQGEHGRVILVGRGGRDNDALTTRHARPHDLWLHAKGIAGAHVIVPLEKGTSCPPALLVDAAMLAAYHSDARDEAVTDVSYVERRHVRKPKGSTPGAVTFDREKVIAVRIDRARLEALLATRDGDGHRG